MSIIDILLHIAAAVLGYVIGSVNAAVIITKYILKSDVRERGSKNAGAANVTRVFGPVAGGCTLLLDMAKVMFVMWLGGVIAGETGTATAAIACLTGHCFPIFFGFKGGKAVAVTAALYGLAAVPYLHRNIFTGVPYKENRVHSFAFWRNVHADNNAYTWRIQREPVRCGDSSRCVRMDNALAQSCAPCASRGKSIRREKSGERRKDGKVNEAKIGGGQDAAPFCCKKREYAISFVRYNISKENRTDETTHRYAHKDEKRG